MKRTILFMLLAVMTAQGQTKKEELQVIVTKMNLWETVFVVNGYSTDEIDILSGLLGGMPFDDVFSLLVTWKKKDNHG